MHGFGALLVCCKVHEGACRLRACGGSCGASSALGAAWAAALCVYVSYAELKPIHKQVCGRCVIGLSCCVADIAFEPCGQVALQHPVSRTTQYLSGMR